MYFNNPEIIKSTTDIVLGGVPVAEAEMNFLNLIHQAEIFYIYHIAKDVEATRSDDISYERALMLVAHKIYSRLEMYEQIPPRDEEHLAQLMMRSRNFEMWQSDIKRRFFQVHSGKVTEETKVSVSGDGGFSQDDIIEVLNSVNLDMILERLSMYMDIGNPNNS